MYSPTHSGGGRRQRSADWEGLRMAGRIMMALAAGAAFGALAWEPSSKTEPTSDEGRIAAEMQRNVTAGQDEYQPHLDAFEPSIAPVGDAVTNSQRRESPQWVARATGDGDTDDYSNRSTQADAEFADALSATSGVHSRGPPDQLADSE